MIRTKQQADIHVAEILKRTKDQRERRLRGYQIAKIYVDVKEYEKAKEQLLGFLSVKENSAPGHKLLGQILETQHHMSEAAAAFTKSLNIDQHQKDVLLKICEIYSQINISPELAKFWAEKGEKMYPTNDVIFKLKMKAHGDSKGQEDLLGFLESESAKCPSDPIRRVKLIQSLKSLGHVNKAYTQILEVESKNLHPQSLAWYRCVIETFREYKETTGSNINGKFHQQLLMASNQLTALSIEQLSTVTDAVSALWCLDQELISQSRSIAGAAEDWKILYQEMEAQYLFHCGTLILSKALKDRLSWREASDLAYACFLVSHSVPVINKIAPWYAKASAEERAVYDRWYNDSCWRCSQTGHMLMQKYESSDGGQKWIERIQDEFCHRVGRDRIFSILFVQPQQKDDKERSYLAQCSLFDNNPVVPDKSLLMEWDNVVQQSKPDNLQLAVWTCLHYYSVMDKMQPKYPFTLFESLPYGVQNMDSAAPETLCQLDVIAFLYAAVRIAALKHSSRCVSYDPHRPDLLPMPICEKLCSDSQSEWWTSTYKLHSNNARDSLSRMRAVLQRGLETIRVVGHNLGMDAGLVVHLARTFTEQLEESKSLLESVQDLNINVPFIHARASHYWNKAVELLGIVERKRPLPMQRDALFASSEPTLDMKHIATYLDEGRLFQAVEAKEAGRIHDAVRLFRQLNTPDAAFQNALLYKQIGVSELATSERNPEVSMERPQSLLTRAKKELYETLDRLKGDKYHVLNARVAEELDDVENRLMMLEGRKEKFSFEEDVTATPVRHFDVDEFDSRSSRRLGSDRVVHSTPQVQRSILSELNNTRGETRLKPSPDRLDAQMRSLTHSQDRCLKMIMDEVKDNRSTIQKLQERVTLLESKLQDVQDQLKQSQSVALAAAAVAAQPTLAPPAALTTQPPTAIVYQPTPFRGDGYEYWGSHVFDHAAAVHGGLYRGYQQPVQAAYGVGYSGVPSKNVQHFPAGSRHELDEYGSENFPFVQEHFRDVEQVATVQDVAKVQPAAIGGVVGASLGGVPALQPGFFKQTATENLSGWAVKADDKTVKPSKEAAVPAANTGDQSIWTSAAGSVLTIPGKTGIAQVQQGSGETVLPSLVSSKSEVKIGGGTFVVAPALNRSSESQGEEAGLDDSYTEPHFEPIVTLPEVVDLKTGEEDETAFFSERVKLFRFSDKQWKERGIGILKVLFNEKTRRARVLMRREQVHKVCANHYVKPDMVVDKKSPEDGKVLTWKAVDCSDESPRLEQFCCKFKTEDVATQFVESVEKAKKLICVVKQDNVAEDLSSRQSVVQPVASTISTAPATSLVPNRPPASSAFTVTSKASAVTSTEETVRSQVPQQGLPIFAPAQSTVNKSPLTSAATSKTGGILQPSLFSSTQTSLFGSQKVTTTTSQTPVFASLASVASTSATASVADVSTTAKSTVKSSIFGAQPSIFTAPASSAFPASTVTTAGAARALFGSSVSFTSSTAPSFVVAVSAKSVVTTAASTTIAFGTSSSAFSTSSSAFGTSSSAFGTSSGASFGVSSTTGTTLPAFGGFTFNKPPVITTDEPKDKDAPKEAAKPANPFANFAFGTVAKSAEESGKAEITKPSSGFGFTALQKNPQWPASGQGSLAEILKDDEREKPVKPEQPTTVAGGASGASAAIFGQSASTAGMSFAALASSSEAGFQSKKTDGDIFKDRGKPLFGVQKDSDKDPSKTTDEGHDENTEEFEPNRSFEALVSLPEVEVKTGEEDELKLFGERAKLYRLDTDSKQWKERGVGEIKILQHRVSKKFRILMRREQVLKICANHYVTSKMKLLPMTVSDNAWCWLARDFAEEEIREEQLAVKFKTPEQAENFKKCFEDCQRQLSNVAEKETPEKAKATSGADDKAKSGSQSLADQFKPKVGEWLCDTCYVKNAVGSVVCAACQSAKPQPKIATTTKIENIGPVLSAVPLAAAFKPKAGDWQCDACYMTNASDRTLCAACESPKPKPKTETLSTKPNVESAGRVTSSLASQFKPKAGEWNCNECYCKNDGSSTKCVACESPNPNAKQVTQDQPVKNPTLELKFGPAGGFVIPGGQAVNFGKSFGSVSSSSDSSNGETGGGFTMKPTGFGQVSSGFSGFTFGGGKAASETPVKDSSNSGASAERPPAPLFAFKPSGVQETERPSESGLPGVGFGTSQPIFGTCAPSTKSVFGTPSTERTAPLFGTPSTEKEAPSNKPLFSFGGAAAGSTASPGFTFSGKAFSVGGFGTPKPADPQQTNESAEIAKPVEVKKPIFAAPSLSSTTTASSSSSITSAFTTACTTSAESKPIFGTPSFSFTGISAKESVQTLKPSVGATSQTTPTKPNVPKGVAASPASPQSPGDGFYRNTDGEDDHIVFEPIVKMPDNVEIKTGEEDEEVLYSQRAKLYRFAGNEWKERGVGDVKILRHRANNQLRMLMRREKILKICLNHRVVSDMSLKPMPNTEGKAWTWHAEDFAEGEPVHEKFSLKFKDAKVAAEFEAAFNKAVHLADASRSGANEGSQPAEAGSASASLLMNLLTKASSKAVASSADSDCLVVDVKLPSPQLIEKANDLQLSKYFYNYLDSPGCPGCAGCDSDSFDFSKIGQSSSSPGVGKASETSVSSSSPAAPVVAAPRFVFGSAHLKPDFPKPAVDFTMKKSDGKSDVKSDVKSKEAPPVFSTPGASAPLFAPASSATTGFLFGSPASRPLFGSQQLMPSVQKSEQASDAPAFVFGNAGGSVDFASLAGTTTGGSVTSSFTHSKSDPNFKWEGTGSALFGGAASPSTKDKEDNESGEEGHEEENCNATFTPIVQLPEVEVKTGEEDEELLFRDRAKLYRFDNGQWKERGVGDMKILKHKLNGAYRLLLRREQVHKVACNHLLTVDMKLQPMKTADTTWCWFAQDFSEGEGRMEQFALKFKTKDIADKFKAKFDECQLELSSRGPPVSVVASHVSSAVPSDGSSQARTTDQSLSATGSVSVNSGHGDTTEQDDEDEEEEEDEDVTPLFSKRASVKYKTEDQALHDGGLVEILTVLDDDVGGYRLQMNSDNGELICNHIICAGYELKRLAQRNNCEWVAKDFAQDEPVRKTFRVTFSSAPALDEFERVFREGVAMAVQSELSESRADEYHAYSGEGDDDDDDDDCSD